MRSNHRKNDQVNRFLGSMLFTRHFTDECRYTGAFRESSVNKARNDEIKTWYLISTAIMIMLPKFRTDIGFTRLVLISDDIFSTWINYRRNETLTWH